MVNFRQGKQFKETINKKDDEYTRYSHYIDNINFLEITYIAYLIGNIH